MQAEVSGDGWKILAFPAILLGTNPKDIDWVDAQFTPQPIASFEEPLRLIDKPSLGRGLHYLQEDHPDMIGQEIAAWLKTLQ